jgi:hypothetical protein
MCLAIAAGSLLSVKASVPAADITLQPVITNNLPVMGSLTAYSSGEQTITDRAAQNEPPLYYPFNGDALTNNDAWWDDIVAETLQARMPVILFATRGCYRLDDPDRTGPGNMNPRRISGYLRALTRAGGNSLLKVACFVDCPALSGVYKFIHNLPSGSKMDYSVQSDWEDVYWLRAIKPWFDTVPSSMWYKEGSRPRIEFWGQFDPSSFTNGSGNFSQMLLYLEGRFQATYGLDPVFVVGGMSGDPTLTSVPAVIGDNPWNSWTKSWGFKTYNSYIAGCAGPGGINPNNPTGQFVPRNGNAGTGVLGDSLREGLNQAVSQKANLTVLEGWTDISESSGFYRCANPTAWTTPNQYIDIIRSYTDLRTVTLRLEAEGCDSYGDTTTGNSGGAFLRAGEDLDVRLINGTYAITCSSENAPFQFAYQAFDGDFSSKWYTPTNAPGWLQYDYGSGNSEAIAGYSITSSDYTQNRDPKDWTFQASNNGTTWTTLDTRSGQTFAGRNTTNNYTFTNTVTYRYYRLNVSANFGGAGNGIAIAELSFKSTNSHGGGWAVTNTAANEWIEWDNLFFSAGNYKFPIRYSSTASHTVRLAVDGVALPNVTVPSTGGTNTFDTISLGSKALTHGAHTLRVTFVDGGVDLDWLFTRKFDSMVSFKAASNNLYVTAVSGGGTTLAASAASEGSFERMSVESLTGGGTINSGDAVSIQVLDGYYLSATSGGGSTVISNIRTPGTSEQFTITKVSGSGAITSGTQVTLKSRLGNYLTVGSGNTINASGTTVGSAQTFTVNLSSQ